MDTWINVIRRYFEDCGLADRNISRLAAERVVSAVTARSGATGSDRAVEALALARRWIAEFAREGTDPLAWSFRARRLLQRFPASFLELEIPEAEEAREHPTLLPAEQRVAMRQQEIHGPIHGLASSVGQALETMSGLETGRP